MSKEGDNIVLSKDLVFGVVVAGLIILLIASIFTGGFGIVQQSTPTDTEGDADVSPEPETPDDTGDTELSLATIQIDGGSLPPLGSEDAPVSIIEFSDYQCPYCARFYSETEPLLISNYMDTGKAKFYYRDYPLIQLGHANADDASLAARCANDEGKFWEYHNKLSSEQSSWSSLSDEAITETLVSYAEELELDTDTFSTCLTEQIHAQAVVDDIGAGQMAVGGNLGTPSFFILIPKDKITQDSLDETVSGSPYYPRNIAILGQTSNEYVVIVQGALPYSSFKEVLDAVNY